MKVYRCNNDKKGKFILRGSIVLCVALGATIYQIVTETILFGNLIYSIFANLLCITYGVMYTIRFLTYKVVVNKDELLYWDGLFDYRHIPFSSIDKIEYNPEMKVYITLNNRQRTYFSLVNALKDETWQEIFEEIHKQVKRIPVIAIKKPEKLIIVKQPEEKKTNKKEVEEKEVKKISKKSNAKKSSGKENK